MAIDLLIGFIRIAAQLIILLVIAAAILSFIMPPYHPVRRALDNIVNPLLAPIRRVVPLVGMFDFSPLILILIVQLLAVVLTSLLSALR